MAKYKNIEIVYDNIRFQSQKEGQRYLFLKAKQKEGVISDLKLQPRFELLPTMYKEAVKQLKTKSKVVQVCVEKKMSYNGDFSYIKDGALVVEDVKGGKATQTDVFKIKKKLMYYFHKIEIKIVTSATDNI